jgi:hypothetical protein
MRGYIYILRTSERPGVVKIGKTTVLPKTRCQQINQGWYLSLNTWEVAFWRWVEDCNIAEKEIHRLIAVHNLGAKSHREAFRVNLETAKDIAKRVCARYPAKSDKRPDPILNKKKSLDESAYRHIQKNGPLSEKIIQQKKLLNEADFYKWLSEILYLL